MVDLAKMKKDEWLEADGLGGFASATVAGLRTRRYHALLLAATKPPAGRFVLVNGFDGWVETPGGNFALSSQLYNPEVLYPDGARRITEFKADPWPQWLFSLEDGTKIQQEIFAVNGASVVALSWRLLTPTTKADLSLRPLLSGRDYHFLHRENPGFRFEPEIQGKRMVWHPYPGLPGIIAVHNGEYLHQPDWYRNFLYEEERGRGLDFAEDLASPGTLRWDLSRGEAVWILGAEGLDSGTLSKDGAVDKLLADLGTTERKRRQSFSSTLERSADAYLARRGRGKTIVAGYPWFTDWGRDTFIALRGLCLATERVEEARDILLEWSGAVSEGMLPNRFPDQGDTPEYNSVDASLWYIVAVHEFLSLAKKGIIKIRSPEREKLRAAVEEILSSYAEGTRFGIRRDDDGLLAAGEPGVQLTWMDAKVGDWVVTPRIGKPVEVQALWLNALRVGRQFSERWNELYSRGLKAFQERFWNEERGCLYDVVDVDHKQGAMDASLRPNQIFAVGGLPIPVLDGARAAKVVDAVESHLWTPLGLRSLAPEEPGYVPRYEGGVRERDAAYHQGTVWPWLLGPFIEAWVRVHGGTKAVKQEARRRFFEPLLEHVQEVGIGHISEIADADPPHAPKGCPFQAWSVGEALRTDLMVLADNSRTLTKKARMTHESTSAT